MTAPINYPENNDNNDHHDNHKDNETIRKDDDTTSKTSVNEKIESLFANGSKQSQNDTDVTKENHPRENTQNNAAESQRENNMYRENNHDIPGLVAIQTLQDYYKAYTCDSQIKDHLFPLDQRDYYDYQNFNYRSKAHSPYLQQQLHHAKPLNSKGNDTNSSYFLINDENQKPYRLRSLIAGFTISGILGTVMAIYYLFILDDEV